MYTDIIHITLNYKCTLYIKVAYTNCLTGSSNIYIGKTLVLNFSTPSSHLSLNKSIDLTNISL